MPKARSKEVEVSKADWEKEVPELTQEQLKIQTEILRSLGKKSVYIHHTPDASIEDYRIILPEEGSAD